KSTVTSGDMLEHAHVFGNFYGSPKAPVSKAIDAGRDVLFDIDWQGAQQIKNSTLQEHVLSVFILPPSIAELKRRLESRGQDSADTISKRMQKSWDEISHWDGYDHVLINDDLNATEQRLQTIVQAARLRRSQQPNLMNHVRKLQSEFGDS
ncbi:MAG: guanylate kinase, partial [Pseudomonadota bacterium]